MLVERLALKDYRNWESLLLDLSPGINVIYGPNGSGKTNIAESVSLLGSGSSDRARLSLLPRHGCEEAGIKAKIKTNLGRRKVLELAIKSAKLRAREDGGGWTGFSKISPLACISFSPADLSLCSSPERRRSFLDEACLRLFPDFAEARRRASRTLAQKSRLLREAQIPGGRCRALLESSIDAFNLQLSGLFFSVTRARKEAFEKLSPSFSKAYKSFSSLEARISYAPSMPEALEEGGREKILEKLELAKPRELAAGFALLGPQRDDFRMFLQGWSMKEVASGGQSWLAALALRMAQFEAASDSKPVLVLDDAFAQLDFEKRENILSSLSGAQAIITSTGRGDVPLSREWNAIPIRSLQQKAFL